MDETSTQDLKSQVEEAVVEVPGPDINLKPMQAERYTFPLDFKADNGKRYTGTFTHAVPSLGQRMAIGALRSKLTGGVPYETLDPFTRELTMMISDLTVSLEDKSRPEWAVDLRAMKDPDVIYKLWEVAALHEATFLGRRPPKD